MAISVLAVTPNQTIPPGTAQGGLHLFSGIIECLFRGNSNEAVTRDTLTFRVGRVNLSSPPPKASCTVSLASFGYDGAGDNALWAVDGTKVSSDFVNIDRGSGTADVEVVATLAIRGRDSFVLRVNYTLFYIK